MKAEAEALADLVSVRVGGREGLAAACLSRRGSGDGRGTSSRRGVGDTAGEGLKAAGPRSSVGREIRLVGADFGRWS